MGLDSYHYPAGDRIMDGVFRIWRIRAGGTLHSPNDRNWDVDDTALSTSILRALSAIEPSIGSESIAGGR